MRALKILVVAMGLLLVAGTAVLVVAVIARINRQPTPASPLAAHATTIDLPPGAHVVGTQASGGRLVIRVGLADGGEELLVLDLASGARVAAITLQTKPATTRHDLPETPVPQR
ncbi:MAG TPA: DUF6476 family protein [Stellaceae bacterium]|nr:DUF6476 family protein [Stellaceae bacterium]